MYDRIGIDTHGYDEPPDEPEFEPSADDVDRMYEILDEIEELIAEYRRLNNYEKPHIVGYVDSDVVEIIKRSLNSRIKALEHKLENVQK